MTTTQPHRFDEYSPQTVFDLIPDALATIALRKHKESDITHVVFLKDQRQSYVVNPVQETIAPSDDFRDLMVHSNEPTEYFVNRWLKANPKHDCLDYYTDEESRTHPDSHEDNLFTALEAAKGFMEYVRPLHYMQPGIHLVLARTFSKGENVVLVPWRRYSHETGWALGVDRLCQRGYGAYMRQYLKPYNRQMFGSSRPVPIAFCPQSQVPFLIERKLTELQVSEHPQKACVIDAVYMDLTANIGKNYDPHI